MRDLRGVLSDATIVGERRHRGRVLKTQPAQHQPPGLQNRTTFVLKIAPEWDSSRVMTSGSYGRCEEGEPASRLPLAFGAP